jgi:phenylacetyl-CoA:acceptor oxidoreductase
LRIGGTDFSEQFWRYEGFALRQAAIEPRGEARDFTEIATELATRTGLREAYNHRINKGAAGVRLAGKDFDFNLDTEQEHTSEEIWEAVCKAASAELSDGEDRDGLDWYHKHGLKLAPFPQTHWYLYPSLVDKGLRFELPYQENLQRTGAELGNRLHEHGIEWWNDQLAEYQALPPWKDFPGVWNNEEDESETFKPEFPFWLLTARSMQYSWGANAGIQLMQEVASNVAGHGGVIINTETAAKMGIADGDEVEVRSELRATKGRAVLRNGIRPDTLLMIGQFDHWKMPFAKDLKVPSMNTVTPISLKLTDATGSSSDIVRVAIRRLQGAA